MPNIIVQVKCGDLMEQWRKEAEVEECADLNLVHGAFCVRGQLVDVGVVRTFLIRLDFGMITPSLLTEAD